MTGREVVIAGIFETAQERVIDRNAVDVTLEALHGALADAGLTWDAVDGIAIEFTGPGGAPGEPSSWARFFRQPMRWSCDTNNDAGGIRGLMKATAMISAGVCDTVLMGGARAGRDATRREMRSLSAPFGAWGVPVYALIAQRHMHQFGT